ncbi:MAG: hypothetical protein ACLPXB_06245 [Thiobacillaceae bacterium]
MNFKLTAVFRLFGWGTVFGLLILASVEWALHQDKFLQRYRSVFAAGRAMDKVEFIEAHAPRLIFAGNSRMDNGVDPNALMPVPAPSGQAFNLGLPGANVRVLDGLFRRFARDGLLGPGKIEYVVIGLDESLLQAEQGLGYSVFFADRMALWREGAYRDWLASVFRLWGYSTNLKELREPEKALSFCRASVGEVEPIGGGAAEHLGYRAGFSGKFQDAGQVQRQEETYDVLPDAQTVAYLFTWLDLLREHGVHVAVAYPPLRDRTLLFNRPSSRPADPYRAIATLLAQRGIPAIVMDANEWRDPADFINAGHLNDRGAQRYSRILAQHLTTLWPDLWGHATP